jgi:hypothetical protein
VGRRARRRAAAGEGGAGAGATSAAPGAARPKARSAGARASAPSRSERRNAAARARLEPLADGERPRAVTAGAIVAAVFGAVNAGLWLAGVDIRGQRPTVLALVFSLLLLVTSWGMWRARYWAVLGFQVLLALTLISVALPVVIGASPLQAAIFVVAVLVPGGVLFWFLVKAMARIQMPRRR